MAVVALTWRTHAARGCGRSCVEGASVAEAV